MPDNLCGTTVGEKITEALKESLTAGNERSAECEFIYIDGVRLKSKHKLRSRHKVLGNVVYDATYYVEIDEDLTQPNPENIKICADTPVGKLCIKLSDIIAIIGAVSKASQPLAKALAGIASVLP